MFGAYLIAYAVCLVPMGMLADRLDNTRLLVIGIFLNMAGSALFAVAPNLNVAVLARLTLGVSGSFLYVPSVRYVVAVFARGKRASVMGWVELGTGLGDMLAVAMLPSATA